LALAASLALSGCSLGTSLPMRPQTSAHDAPITERLRRPDTLNQYRTLRELFAVNPHLRNYKRLAGEPFSGAFLWGPRDAGTGLQLMVNKSSQVVGIQAKLPAGTERKAWYDRLNTPQAGTGALVVMTPTQSAYFTALNHNTPEVVLPRAQNGPTPSTAGTTVEENAGGSAHPGSSLTIDYDRFVAANPAWRDAERLGDERGGRHAVWGYKGWGLRVLVDDAKRIVGFVGVFPAAANGDNWRPQFDQARGAATHDGSRAAWTQHVWLVDPQSL
ncbi:MAG TPA: hypothetical protein VFK80_08610, partial [Limnochordia bacterium]|nr:hypothetical protein [Limnochordia bacterium]